MHQEAYDGFARMLALAGIDPNEELRILDVGGADVNGSVRAQLPNATFIGLDIAPAPGVQIVADAADPATWRNMELFDIVIATELFEHTEAWPAIIEHMSLALSTFGHQLLIATCASTGRAPHGARGEYGVPVGEYYGNVAPEGLRLELSRWFQQVHVEYNPNPGDAYMWARGLILDEAP